MTDSWAPGGDTPSTEHRDAQGGPPIRADDNVRETTSAEVFDAVIADYLRRGDEETRTLAGYSDIAYDSGSQLTAALLRLISATEPSAGRS